MADVGNLTEMERLLLMAAAVHGLGPDTDLSRANSANVVGQALRWSGQVNDEVRAAWESIEYCPVITRCYGALIRMAHQTHRVGPGLPPERLGEALFEAAGNLGTAADPQAFPHFTSCRLTTRGLEVAEQLLEQHPGYRKSAERGAAPDRGRVSGSGSS